VEARSLEVEGAVMSVNPYEGMTWNGKRWMAPDESGELVEQKLTIWQKSKLWEKIFMVVVFGGGAVAIGFLTGNLHF